MRLIFCYRTCIPLNVSRSLEESFVQDLCKYLFTHRIDIEVGRTPLKMSLSFALSAVCAYMLLLVVLMFFVLSCRSKATVMRLSTENLNALEIQLWLFCVTFLKCSEQRRLWIN